MLFCHGSPGVMGFGEDDLRGNVHFHHCIMGTWHLCDLCLVMGL